MLTPDDVVGRVGRVRRGPQAEMFVQVERDAAANGWHLWLLTRPPIEGPSDGWDIWADEWADVLEWLGPESLDVDWSLPQA